MSRISRVGPPLLDNFDLVRQQRSGQPGKVQQPAPRGPMGPPAPAGTLPNQGANPPMALASNHPQVAQRPPDSFDVVSMALGQGQVQQPATGPTMPQAGSQPQQAPAVGQTLQEGPQLGGPGQTAYMPMSAPPMALASNHTAEPSRIWGTGGQPVQTSPPQTQGPGLSNATIGPATPLSAGESFSTAALRAFTSMIPDTGNSPLARYKEDLKYDRREPEGAAGVAGDLIGGLIPSLVGVLFPPAAPMVIAAFAGSSAKNKLEKTGNQWSALGTGAIEAGTEMIGLGAAMRFGAKNMGRLSKLVLKGDTSTAFKMAVDAGIMTGAEGGEEVLNVIGEEGLDATLGLQTWATAMENIRARTPRAFASGVAGAILLGPAALAGQAIMSREAMSSPVSPSAQSQGTPRSSAEVPAPQTTTPALSTAPQPAPTQPTTVAATLTPQATPPVAVQPTPETPRPVSEPAVPPQAAAVENQSRPSQAPPAESTPPVERVEPSPAVDLEHARLRVKALSRQISAGMSNRKIDVTTRSSMYAELKSHLLDLKNGGVLSASDIAAAGKVMDDAAMEAIGVAVHKEPDKLAEKLHGLRNELSRQGLSRGELNDIRDRAIMLESAIDRGGRADLITPARTLIREANAAKPVEVAPVAGKAVEDVDSLSYSQLRARAKELHLSPVGSLAVLRERVKGAGTSERTPSPASPSSAAKGQAEAGPQEQTGDAGTGKTPQSTEQVAPDTRPAVPSEPPGKGRRGKRWPKGLVQFAESGGTLKQAKTKMEKLVDDAERLIKRNNANLQQAEDRLAVGRTDQKGVDKFRRDVQEENTKLREGIASIKREFKKAEKFFAEQPAPPAESKPPAPDAAKGASLQKGDKVRWDKQEAEVLIPDIGDAGWKPGIARIKYTTGPKLGQFQDVESEWLTVLKPEETAAGKEALERTRVAEQKAAEEKRIVESLIANAVPVVRQLQENGVNLTPTTKKGKQELLNKVAVGTDIRNNEILQAAIDRVANPDAAKAKGEGKKESTVDRLEREAKGGSGSMSALGSPDKPLPSPAAIKGTRVQPSPLTGEVKQIKDIILDLESGVGHVRAGKSSKGSIGTYYPGSSKTVIRFANDLDTTAHETAHRLDDLYGIVADWATPRGVSKSGANLPQKSPFDAELRKDIFQQTIRKNYSVVKKRAEGVAEWIRAWVVNPDMAKSEAPNFTKWFEQKVPQNVRDRLRSFGDDIRRFAGAPGSEQTTANVNLGVDSKSVLDRVKEWFEADGVGGTVGDRLGAAAIDSLAPVWKGVELARTLRGLSELRPRLDPKINIRLFAGFDRKAMDVLEHGPIRANGERVADIGGIDWLMEPIKAGKPEQVEQNFKDVVAWGLSERIVERAELLNNAVNRAEELEDRIAEAKAAIRKAQEAGDGESMGSLVDQLKSDIKELSRVKKQVGFAGPTTKMRSWVEARKQRLSGMGGGVMSDIGVAQETLREIASDPARQARAEEGARRYRLWSDAVLRYMLDKGRISQAQFDAIQENNNRYFAMKREYERINDEFIKHGGRKLGTVSKVIQRFKGSTRTIENPYVSLLEQTYAFMREADRNAALRTFTDLLTKERSMYQGKAIDFDQIGSRAKAGDQDAITVFEDGREVKWQFAPEIHRSLKDFGKTPDQSIVSKILAAPASLLRTMVVMSPDFMVRNQIRDPVARSIVSETGSKPWSQFYYLTPDGMAEFNADLSRFRRMGAGLFGHNLISRDDYYRRFKEAFDKVSGKRNVIITVPSKLVEGYRNFAEFGETIGRMAEFHRAEKKGREQLGYGPEDAAMYAAAQARDIQDFAIAGHAAREVNRYVPFFNAAIRGVMKSVQSAKANPAGFAARWMLYAAMPEVMFYLWNTLVGDDEEEFDQLPTYQRDFFWNMKIGPDLWLAIPKPWELGVMASGIGRAIDAARGKENAFDDYYKSLGSSTSPIGHEGLVGPWRGLIEVMANYDFFRNRPIVSPWEKDLDLGLREGDDHASRVGQLIQKAFGIDARNADHLIRSYLGGYGRAGLTASDIGREDKPTALRTTGQQLSGVLKSSPAAFGKDAEWVSEYARRKGETNKKWYRAFRTLIDAYYDADNSSERDEAAKRIREESSSLRASRPKD